MGLEIKPTGPLLPLGPSCPLQAILLGDLVGWSLQQAATLDPANSNVKKSALNGHYNLQRAVIPTEYI